MPYYDWDEAKNQMLKAERGVGFEDVQAAIDSGRLLDDIPHPNKKRYGHQRILVIEVNRYAYLVPYVKDETKIFLKTIIPNRKATKHYIRSNEKGD